MFAKFSQEKDTLFVNEFFWKGLNWWKYLEIHTHNNIDWSQPDKSNQRLCLPSQIGAVKVYFCVPVDL